MLTAPFRHHRLRSLEDPYFAECWELYESAFPEAERRTLGCQAAAMAGAEDFYALRFDAQREFAGIAFFWKTPQFVYLEHLAICPQRRGQGLGHFILKLLHRLELPLILEIEPVVDAATERRWNFYRTAGFHLLPFEHWQPCYHHEDAPMQLSLLSSPHAASAEEIAAYERFMQERVAHYTEDGLNNA